MGVYHACERYITIVQKYDHYPLTLPRLPTAQDFLRTLTSGVSGVGFTLAMLWVLGVDLINEVITTNITWHHRMASPRRMSDQKGPWSCHNNGHAT